MQRERPLKGRSLFLSLARRCVKSRIFTEAQPQPRVWAKRKYRNSTMDNNTLFSLLSARGVSGNEGAAGELFTRLIRPYVDEVTVDIYGNFIAHRHGSGQKVMFAAHIDEVGLMVTYIDPEGYLYFQPVGGVDVTILPAQRVIIEHEGREVVGVIGKKAIHLMTQEERGKSQVKAEDLWIDIGVSSKEEAEARVSVGDYISYSTTPYLLSSEQVCCKSLDDRAGVFTLIEIARLLADKPMSCDLYLVASLQEEIGCRGVRTAAFSIRPEVGIAIDVTHATDYPSVNPKRSGKIELGKGVVIAKGPNIAPELASRLVATAQRESIPYQLEAIAHPTGTDANLMQVSAEGIRTALLSIPCRYMHTPNEVVALSDIEAAARLGAGVLV